MSCCDPALPPGDCGRADCGVCVLLRPEAAGRSMPIEDCAMLLGVSRRTVLRMLGDRRLRAARPDRARRVTVRSMAPHMRRRTI